MHQGFLPLYPRDHTTPCLMSPATVKHTDTHNHCKDKGKAKTMTFQHVVEPGKQRAPMTCLSKTSPTTPLRADIGAYNKACIWFYLSPELDPITWPCLAGQYAAVPNEQTREHTPLQSNNALQVPHAFLCGAPQMQ